MAKGKYASEEKGGLVSTGSGGSTGTCTHDERDRARVRISHRAEFRTWVSLSVWEPVPVTVPVAAGNLHLINWSRLGSELGGGFNCLINDRVLI